MERILSPWHIWGILVGLSGYYCFMAIKMIAHVATSKHTQTNEHPPKGSRIVRS